MMFIVCIWCFTMVFCVHVGAFGDLQSLKFPALYLGPLGPGPSPRGHGPRSQPAAPSKRLCRWDPAPGHRQGEPLVPSQDAELFFDFAITFAPFHLVNLVRPRCIMCNIYNYIWYIYIWYMCVYIIWVIINWYSKVKWCKQMYSAAMKHFRQWVVKNLTHWPMANDVSLRTLRDAFRGPPFIYYLLHLWDESGALYGCSSKCKVPIHTPGPHAIHTPWSIPMIHTPLEDMIHTYDPYPWSIPQ